MQINVTVNDIDLTTTVPHGYDGEVTLADLVVDKLVAEFKRSDDWGGLRDTINRVREEEIRAQLAPVIAEAVNNPIVHTSVYGEPTGKTTTLRELIVKEAREALTRRSDNYGRSNETNLSKIVRAEVERVFTKEVADTVKKVRAQVVGQIGDTAKDQITAAALDALKPR